MIKVFKINEHQFNHEDVIVYMALNEVYNGLIILMCWFHVKLNVRKHKNLIPVTMHPKVLRTIDAMHNSKTKDEFDRLVKLNVDKW